jgi:mannonate dehydratase
MAKLMQHYVGLGIDVPVRVDHVPTMSSENSQFAGYDALGRYFAIGYLKGILDACKK